MDSRCWNVMLLIMIMVFTTSAAAVTPTNFEQNYEASWGAYHVKHINQGIQLTMDKTSGAGFGSKANYGSGLFHMRIKVPNRNSAGVVTAYYLSSNTSNHDELDFEFLGNIIGKPTILQTNIFTNGIGNREQKITLWFDPTADFHDYKMLWNPSHIVFFVDGTPIRVYKNLSSQGVNYPSQPMRIMASLWDGEDWATDGGKIKTDWSQAPFTAQFQGFDVDGCAVSGASSCASTSLWWNTGANTGLSPAQQAAYEHVKKNLMIYDYCNNRALHTTTTLNARRTETGPM